MKIRDLFTGTRYVGRAEGDKRTYSVYPPQICCFLFHRPLELVLPSLRSESAIEGYQNPPTQDQSARADKPPRLVIEALGI